MTSSTKPTPSGHNPAPSVNICHPTPHFLRSPFSILRSPFCRAAGPRAFTLIEIMIVVAIIGIIIAIAMPAFMRARENSRGRGCQENLSKIDGAKQQYALEKKIPEGTAMTDPSVLWDTSGAGTGYLRSEPKCPSDNSAYTYNPIGEDPTCPNDDPATPYVRHFTVGSL